MAYEQLQDEAINLTQRTVLSLVSPFGFAYDDAPNSRSVLAIGYDSGGTLRAECRTTTPFLRFTGQTHILNGFLGVNTPPRTDQAFRAQMPGTYASIGMNMGNGATVATPSAVVLGIAGYAVTQTVDCDTAWGLYFTAGAAQVDATTVVACRTLILQTGAGKTIGDARHYDVGGDAEILGTITTLYGYHCRSMVVATNRLAFYDEGQPAGDNHGNRFASNTQFASVVGAFGGGAGVIGIANATVIPTWNPAGGGVLYVNAGALTYRGPAGTITVIAPA